ncbi:serine--tRNA ligase [Striga asiatica]|uniref:Serine--tRNA ligase n=1 Tax=Striga asiatica TaxID=4170 RepID=A0A5A7P7M2_STRAF|nr:serine--tRNA ligase [Striga asiatica]
MRQSTLKNRKLVINGRGLHLAIKGWTLGVVVPAPSLISISPTFSQLKHWINEPSPSPSVKRPKFSPGQARLPDPNGKNLKPNSFFPSNGSNLSGLNLSGSAHTFGLWWISHMLTNRMVPAGTLCLPTAHSAEERWGISIDTGGWRRSVSRTTWRRYGSAATSDSEMRRPWPTWASISDWAFMRVSGFSSRRVKAHSRAMVDVDDPPWSKT